MKKAMIFATGLMLCMSCGNGEETVELTAAEKAEIEKNEAAAEKMEAATEELKSASEELDNALNDLN